MGRFQRREKDVCIARYHGSSSRSHAFDRGSGFEPDSPVRIGKRILLQAKLQGLAKRQKKALDMQLKQAILVVTMPESKFVYVIHVRTIPEKLWDALTTPEFTRSYWCGTWHETTWEPGSSWKLMIPDGRVGDCGEIVAVEKPRRLVLR